MFNQARCLGAAIVFSVALSLPITVLAVDPDMQALVIDNGSGCAPQFNGAECASVPEPSTLSVLAIGLVGLAYTRYRRRKP